MCRLLYPGAARGATAAVGRAYGQRNSRWPRRGVSAILGLSTSTRACGAGSMRGLVLAVLSGVLCVSPLLAGDGAPRRAGPDWWSLQPVRRATPPSVRDSAWL